MTKYEIWAETFRIDHRTEERSNFPLFIILFYSYVFTKGHIKK